MSRAAPGPRAHVWGVDSRLRTVLPAALLAVAAASVPLHGVAARAAVAAAAVVLFAVAVITWSGLTLGQWVIRRVAVAREGRRDLRPA